MQKDGESISFRLLQAC